MPSRHRQRGFTLIEVLVVLVIVGVVIGAMVLASGGSGERQLENAARRAELRIRLACERAMFTGVDVGFSVLAEGLRFGYLLPGRWAPLADAPDEALRLRPLGEGILVQAYRDGLEVDQAQAELPQFACHASGELTPLRLQLGREGVNTRWRLDGHVDGRLELRREDA
ncbi:MAG: type II secretion system minor pseudopilin GspH [Lysobacteraceae bacterium]